MLSFSELREQADIDVTSSQFNYHLQKLVGQFLERIDDGYRLRPEGRLLYKRLVAGTFDRRSLLSSTPVGMDCYYCSNPVEATFDEGVVRIQCPGCEHLYDIATVQPGVVEDGAVNLSQVSQYNHHKHLGSPEARVRRVETVSTLSSFRRKQPRFRTRSDTRYPLTGPAITVVPSGTYPWTRHSSPTTN